MPQGIKLFRQKAVWEGKAIKKRVLVTGAAGRIGRVLREALRDRYKLRLMYHKTPLTPVGDEEAVTGDVFIFDSLLEAIEGVNAVVHLAAEASPRAPWERVLNANMIGTYNVFEAARQMGVKKIVFASSNHITGFWEKESVYVRVELLRNPGGVGPKSA